MTDDQEVVIVGSDGTEHVFPAGFDPKKAASIVAGTDAAPSRSGPKVGLALSTSKAAPVLTKGAEELATSPKAAAIGAKIGRVIGGVAPVIGGAVEGGPVGVAAASRGAWAGGKTGWFTGKLAQNMAAPVAKALEKAAPYAKAVGTLSGAQSVLDLAQMAEPNRTDIGVMGIGKPGLADDRAAVMGAQIKSLIEGGMPQGEAVRAVYNAWAKYLKANR